MKEFTLSFAFVKHLFIISMLFATYAAAENKLQFQGGNFNVTWKHLSASQEIEFEVSVKTIGYVALGLTKINSGMQNLDLFVGGVTLAGTSYLKDYYVTGRSEPPEDSKQDYTLLSASESNGVTMVRCKRTLNTQDVKDQLIQPGDSLYIAWAYHTSADNPPFQRHTNRGYSSQMYVLIPLPSSTTVGPTSSVTTSPDLTSETPTTNVATTSTTTESSTSSSSSLTSIPPMSSASPSPPPPPSSSKPPPASSSSSSSSLTSIPLISSTSTIITAATTTSSITSPTTTLTTLEKTPTESIQTSSTTTTVQSSHTTTTTASTTTATVTISTNTNTQGVVQDTSTTSTVVPTISQGSSPTATVSPTTNSVSIAYDKDLSFKNGDFRVSWKFDSNTNELLFKLVVKATGWVGLGISNINTDMKDMDVVVAGVSGGQGYIGDYYSTAQTTPPRDSREDYILRTATETEGTTTTVEFKRKINTGDNKDLQIVPGESYYIAWAYQSSSDSLSYHGSQLRGYSGQKVVLVAADAGSTTTTARPPSTTSGSKPPTDYIATSSLVMTILYLAYTLIVH